jgi:hypothetical protein
MAAIIKLQADDIISEEFSRKFFDRSERENFFIE